jgi:single-stranded-DNA-specific exonuclease
VKYRWALASPQLELAGALARELGISRLLAQCLLNRGLCDAERISRFIEPRLKHLADPFLLPNMGAAVERLIAARARKEPLVIFGDYDVDGVTATALLTEVLAALGWTVHYYLPHRIDEGYGLTQVGVEKCLEKFPVKLLLAVDCGSKASPTMRWLSERGVDMIVLDHHQLSEPAPEVTALVNPRFAAATGPNFGELCSVGIAFKLAHAVLKRARDEGWTGASELDLRLWLDLVALGTIADLVPLTGENRILVNAGLARLTQTERPGIVALKKVANIIGPVGGYEVGFQLGPRLNAAGRLETALDALRLLLTRHKAEAEALAARLDEQNRERQTIEREIVDAVLARVRATFNPKTDYAIVEGDPIWHIGVVGIVASRVVQEFYRPAIIFGGDGEAWRGSGRSIDGFDLAAALRECDHLLVRHGGHTMAAGLAILPARADDFRARLNAIAHHKLQPEQLQPVLRIDAQVSAAELTWDLLKDIERLQQTGLGNPAVQLMLARVRQQRPCQIVGAEKRHLKFWVTDGTATREAMWFGAGETALPEDEFDLTFSPQLTEFNGTFGIQLKVLDVRRAS